VTTQQTAKRLDARRFLAVLVIAPHQILFQPQRYPIATVLSSMIFGGYAVPVGVLSVVRTIAKTSVLELLFFFDRRCKEIGKVALDRIRS